MTTLRTMGDLFERHRQRTADPVPAPVRQKAPPAVKGRANARRVDLPNGYDLFLGAERVAAVRETARGWTVRNVGAGSDRLVEDKREADALAARIARINAT